MCTCIHVCIPVDIYILYNAKAMKERILRNK